MIKIMKKYLKVFKMYYTTIVRIKIKDYHNIYEYTTLKKLCFIQ